MASTIELKYGTNNQAVTATWASLASGSARASTAIDNTSNLFDEIFFQPTCKSGASGVSATGYASFYVSGTVDGGTTYGEGATGTDAAITLTTPPNVKLIGTLNMVANATTYDGNPMACSPGLGGSLTDHIVIICLNKSGAAFDSTEGNHNKRYQGKQAQSV
jgi:hypothetical protein